MKHNGDINIEFIEKGNRSGAYARLFIPGISSCMPDETPPAPAAEATPPANNNAPDQQLAINIGVAAGTSTTTQHDTSTSTSSTPNQLIQLLNLKSRLYLCKHCFFSSPCRSQLDDHQKAAHPQQPTDDNRQPAEPTDNHDNDGTVDVDAISAGLQSPLAAGHRVNQQLAHIQQMRLDNTFASAHAPIGEHSAPQIEVNLISDGDDNEVQSPLLPPPPAEKCPHCPFETGQPDRLTEHMQYHRCVSAVQLAGNCAHCDYSVADERTLRRHVRLHFSGGDEDDMVATMSSPSPRRRRGRRGTAAVRYFTRYEGLVLSSTTTRTKRTNALLPPPPARRRSVGRCKRRRMQAGVETELVDEVEEEEADADGIDERLEEDTVVIFPVINGGGSAACRDRKSVESVASGGSDKENKIIVDIRTGEVVEA